MNFNIRFLALSFCTAATLAASAIDHTVESLHLAAGQMPFLAGPLYDALGQAKDGELLTLMSKVQKLYGGQMTPAQSAQLAQIKAEYIKELKAFRVDGCSFAFDPNFAFFYDNQNPTFTVKYRDRSGAMKQRTYEASIVSWGLKAELAFRLNWIWFTNDDCNFYESDKVIQLGTGIDLGGAHGAGIGVVYVPFLNAPGGLCLVSLILGASSALSIVTGGSLTPQNV